MRNIWLKELVRDAEGEGAGGAGSVSPEGAQPAPEDSRVKALEDRLAKVTNQLDTQTRTQADRDMQGAVRARHSELDGALNTAKTEVQTSELALADAFDNGEGAQIAKAQRELTEAVARRERADIDLQSFKASVTEAEKKQKATPAGGDLDDKNLKTWKAKHAEWYGVDAEMTRIAHEVDRQIRDAGVLSVGSQEYFDAVDRTMNQKYPDRFGGTPQTSMGGTTVPNTVRKGRIQQSIADGWRRMGINMADPKVVERMVKNRERLVQKGILPDQPVQGRIVTQ